MYLLEHSISKCYMESIRFKEYDKQERQAFSVESHCAKQKLLKSLMEIETKGKINIEYRPTEGYEGRWGVIATDSRNELIGYRAFYV